MGKKNLKNEDIEKELAQVDEISNIEDIPDDILLNEDLDDPLLDEMDAILHGKEYKPKPKPELKEKLYKNSKNQEGSKSNSTNISNNIEIPQQIVKEFTIFLLKKSKSFEEMSFQTILRKIPKEWQFTELILIDTIESIIEKKGITSFNMKMTANSLKFYPIKKKKNNK
ncbi:hypothetical protein DSAG12_00513 [Promethearchaeum syntrophicum]|uniref:Uncharacterized protein n=1 Tax=Promethearchaeum syntrophicum TaxID=2594042 RepID=A0A5B9D6F3_9ARCH|nr:hypothetical protein [Candidatus Prometheoarchaeum syntrophicum]QEE14699.1 hypothetical protein DSAG12_00513 [Candidatus Prometheoarchaeum syntrophicum]